MMKQQRKLHYLSILLLLKAACILLTGCGMEQSGENLQEETRREAGTEEISRTASEDRIVLSVAVPYANGAFTRQVNAFNEENETYFVEIQVYEEESMNAFSNRLTMEILSGKGPDMVNFSGSDYSPALLSERIMENLYDYMESDPDFKREDYYQNILEAFEQDGGLYVLPTSFSVNTMCGMASELGEERGAVESWEMGEMISAFQNSPNGEWLTANHSKTLVLGEICGGCMGNFVDWRTGECRFDSPEFTELLEFADTCPDRLLIANDFSYRDTMTSGKAFLQPVILTDPWRIAQARLTFGDVSLCWPGYPVPDGEKELGGGIAAVYGQGLSICVNSRNKEAAWKFLKSFLTLEAQREETGIPLLKEASEERIYEAMTPEPEVVDGVQREKIRREAVFEGEDPIGLTKITEEDARLFRSIVEGTCRSSGRDMGLYQIIDEEASAFFGRGKGAGEVAEIIQKRATVYVEERMQE